MKHFIGLLLLSLTVACSSTSNVRMADGRYMATYTDKSLGCDASSVVEKITVVASNQCGGTDKINIIDLQNTGAGALQFPHATMIYTCQ